MYIFLIIQTNNFRGVLSDVSAKTATLPSCREGFPRTFGGFGLHITHMIVHKLLLIGRAKAFEHISVDLAVAKAFPERLVDLSCLVPNVKTGT